MHIELPEAACKGDLLGRSEALVGKHDLSEFGSVLGEATGIIVEESERLKELVVEFSRFARLPDFQPLDVALHELIDRTLKLYDGGLEGITIAKRFDPNLDEIKADPQQMQRVFINLIDNLRLDHNYTIFAEVIQGMELVDQVVEGTVIESIRIDRNNS